MLSFSIESMPVKNNQLKKLGEGIYVFRKTENEYYACKKAQNRGVFVDATKNIEEYNKAAQKAQKVSKFESIDEIINFLNDVKKPKKFNKEKHLQKIVQSLPSDQKKSFVETYNDNPGISLGVQKSLQLGFSDLPLFGGIEEKQQRLF